MFVCSSEGLNSVTSDIPSSFSGTQVSFHWAQKKHLTPLPSATEPNNAGCLWAGEAVYVWTAFQKDTASVIPAPQPLYLGII